MSSFDTPPTSEILQEDEDEKIRAVPVRIDHPIMVEPLPARIGAFRRIMFPVEGRAQLVALDDPRRKRLTINVFNTDFILANTEHEANRFEGYIALTASGFGIPHHFELSCAIWARPVAINTTGTNVTFGVSTDIGVMSIVTEQWAN